MLRPRLITSATLLLATSITALNLPTYRGLQTDQSRKGVLQIAFNNPDSEINVWGQDAVKGLTDIVSRLQNNTEIKAIVFTSDVTNYFVAHLDLVSPFDPTISQRSVELFHALTELPQVTIAAVNGVARGAGNELLVSLDMRFAVKSRSRFGQPEIAAGFVPGGGGMSYLPRLIGRGRAMEYILTGKDITAEDAERIGWINKAFDSEREMYAHIDDILEVLTLYTTTSLGLVKQSINVASRPKLQDTIDDSNRFLESARQPETQQLLRDFLVLTRNQSDGDVELHLGENVPALHNVSVEVGL
ncbi:enoyl-CoA hydratase/isomeras-like protein [Stemphylium lycopersici]|uniref:Enoyl-CoA hydratase/isomeras-like protein n=1 Tax=Stemphylium lycopersici TaxID=183478 RepID=A0A364NGQ5_STELY|nr:enoyl-CoA hydratase/isomeras-like protein [Stemphylium lycopersici]